MSRNSPIGQLGMKPMRRPGGDDPTHSQPITQPSRWPAQHFSDAHAQQQGLGQNYIFPHGQAEADPGPPFGQAPAQPFPFNRPPAPDAVQGYGQQASGQPPTFGREPNYGYPGEQPQPPFNNFAPAQQQAGAQPPWSQQPDAGGFDLGNYMPAPGQAGAHGYAQPEAQGYQQQDPALFGSPQHGYAENDGDYDEPLPEEEPPRSRRGLMIVAALVGAIGLGGGMAYTYKTFFGARAGPAPVIKDTQGPTKSRPEVADGRGFAHTDKKLLNRLGDDANPPAAPVTPAAAEPQDEDASSPRRVRTIPIVPPGSSPPVVAAPPGVSITPPVQAAGPPPMISVPGVTLENMAPRSAPPGRVQMPPQGPPPSAARIEMPQQAAPPKAPSQPPVRVVSAANPPPPASAAPEAAPPAKKAPVAKAPPKAPAAPAPKKEAGVTTGTSSSGGYVAVLSSQKSRMDALKVFADMQQKYGDVLSSKTPDVQEANLGDKGVWYRAVVGPPGSREAAVNLCGQLKTAGYTGCWVTAY